MKKIKLKKAIDERDQFLKDHPRMNNFQIEIDEVLDKCLEKDRLEVIFTMMLSSHIKQSEKLTELSIKLSNQHLL